jgi:hypothetical protein
MTRKRQQTGTGSKKRTKIAQKEQSHKGRAIRFTGTRFRLLAFQPLSVTVDQLTSFDMTIRGILCRLTLRVTHLEESAQRTHGGTNVGIEFSLTKETDFLRATQQGLDLLEDFFSALTLVDGINFRKVVPLQLICLDQTKRQEYSIIHFLSLALQHWTEPISKSTIDAVRGILAHWDGLDSGKRLRRAARQYQSASRGDGDVIAFQHAYMGLEALEKPLAAILGIEAGVETVRGKCDACGVEFIRRRTVLAGVRAYILGELHPNVPIPERKRDWKKINELRQDLFHSLKDIDSVEQKASEITPAAMHYLHDALCCLSHAHDLENDTFRMGRGLRQLVFVGQFRADNLSLLEDWEPLFSTEDGIWSEHPEYGFVPSFQISNAGLRDLSGFFFWLDSSLRQATKDGIELANWENHRGIYGSN